MPGLTTRPEIPHYVPAQPTKEPLDYADLAVIDLAKARTTPEDLQALVEDIRTAMSTQGFFYMERIFDIANVPFTQVPEDEKKLYHAKPHETGSFQGYKPRQYWHIEGGVRDQMEQYNINRNVARRTHPEAIRPFIPEVDAFARHNHFNVVQPILRLLALGLELPENTFVDMHDFNATGESFVRFMKYYPRSEEDEVKSKNVWFKGHTGQFWESQSRITKPSLTVSSLPDFGTITLLYSQPVAALQILGLDGKWRWVRHMENAIVINAGDAMEFLSGGYYKATIHRQATGPILITSDLALRIPFSESSNLPQISVMLPVLAPTTST
ncbi:Clavaminate synthase-like protein [Moniliophthora roreri]|nr:Clavaminate synthase-like protein [Moniliophthora roreri]